jgi:hypothetical protein
MHALNWLLINGAAACLWLWGLIANVFGWAWAGVDTLLNPVLSPVLAVLNPVCRTIGDWVYAGLSPLPAWLGLTLLSVAAGMLMLIAFRYTSNQAAIGRARDRITANLLALKLFKEDIRTTLRAQRRVLGALARLQWHMLRPIALMLPPMLLIMAQMGLRYQWRPLRPGERTLIRLRLAPQVTAGTDMADAELLPSAGVIVEAGPVPGGGEAVWRVRGGALGRHTLRFRVGQQEFEKELVVGSGLQRVSAIRPGRDWTAQILHPAEPRLPADAPVRSIEIEYGQVASWFDGSTWWIVWFFVISMLAALLLKPVFRVRF